MTQASWWRCVRSRRTQTPLTGAACRTAPCAGVLRHWTCGQGWARQDELVRAISSMVDGLLRRDGETSCPNAPVWGPGQTAEGYLSQRPGRWRPGIWPTHARLMCAQTEQGPGCQLPLPGHPQTREIEAPGRAQPSAERHVSMARSTGFRRVPAVSRGRELRGAVRDCGPGRRPPTPGPTWEPRIGAPTLEAQGGSGPGLPQGRALNARSLSTTTARHTAHWPPRARVRTLAVQRRFVRTHPRCLRVSGERLRRNG